MTRFIVFRCLAAVLTVWLASMVVFAMVRAAPGDIIEMMMGQMGSSEGEAALRRFFGLDQPVYVQYLDWLGRVVTGDSHLDHLSWYQPIRRGDQVKQGQAGVFKQIGRIGAADADSQIRGVVQKGVAFFHRYQIVDRRCELN